MKTSRILSILFSLTQFILVLKLIEFVRGEDAEQGLENRVARHFFVAPNIQKRKKNRPWLTTSSTTTTEESFYSIETATETNFNFTEESEFNHTTSYISRNGIALDDRNNSVSSNSTGGIEKLKKKNEHGGDGETITSSGTNSNDNMARLCPACANGECNGDVQGAGFPVIAVGVAIVAAVIWFFIFLWIVKFFEKNKSSTNSGYGYGGDSLNNGVSLTYNSPSQMARYMNSFLASEELGTVTKFVLGALDKFAGAN